MRLKFCPTANLQRADPRLVLPIIFNYFPTHIPISHLLAGFSKKNWLFYEKILWFPHGWIMELPFTLHVASEIFTELTFSAKCWVVSSLETRARLGSSGLREGETCSSTKCSPTPGATVEPQVSPGGSGSAPACDGSVLANHLRASMSSCHTHPFRSLTLKSPSRLLQSLIINLRSPGVSWISAMCDVMFVSTEDPLRK